MIFVSCRKHMQPPLEGLRSSQAWWTPPTSLDLTGQRLAGAQHHAAAQLEPALL